MGKSIKSKHKMFKKFSVATIAALFSISNGIKIFDDVTDEQQ